MIKLTDAQTAALDIIRNADKPVAWLGAIRGGKTFGSAFALIDRMKTYTGNYAIGAYTYGNIERNVSPYIREICEKTCTKINWKTGQKGFKIAGSDCSFFSAYDVESKKGLQGITLRGAYIDEVTLIPKSFVMEMVGRLSVEPPMLLLTANKSKPNHWLKTEWIDKGKVIEINTLTSENPYIGKTSQAWYSSLLTGHYADTMLKNEWSSAYNTVGEIEFTDDFPPYNSACTDFHVAYLTFGRTSALLSGYIYKGNIYIESLTMAEANDLIALLQENDGIKVCNDIDASIYGVNVIKTDINEWAAGLSQWKHKCKIKLDLQDYLNNIGSWIYKDDVKADETGTEIIALGMTVFYFGNSVETFGIKGRLI